MKVIYVSYDGALDPLGASQVVPYLLGLAGRGFSVTLISFEKRERWAETSLRVTTQHQLASRSIRWRPLPYHKRSRLAATLWDIVVGSRTIASEVRRDRPALVHCRGEVSMVMARLAGLPGDTGLLYDVRGFFSDERVQAGSWRRGGFVDRVVRRMEIANLRRADGAVVLTDPAATQLLRRRPSLPFHRVIPTCTDTSLFTPRTSGQAPEYGLVYSGSLGTWYMAHEMVAFARSAARFVGGPTLFLTPQTEYCRGLGLPASEVEIRAVEPGEVASWLRRARVLFFFARPIASRCPTKFAEGLAAGLPVVCNRGIGDLDEIVEAEKVGVVVESFSDHGYEEAGRRLQLLLEDPRVVHRCRRLAESRYSLELGVEAYSQLYQDIASAVRDRSRGQ